jgi:hypothetical protein
MANPKGYDGRGTIIAFSTDGTTFRALPLLQRFWRMPSVTETDQIECMDSDGTSDFSFPVGVKKGNYAAEGPYDSQNPGIIAAHAYHQALRIIHYKVTLIDGNPLLTGRCRVAKFEFDVSRQVFKLQTTDHTE